jgi:hypothetical protein
MELLAVPGIALPAVSFAGVKRARRRMTLHVVLSSEDDPLDFVIVQLVTLPSVPISSLKPVVPCCSALMAAAG